MELDTQHQMMGYDRAPTMFSPDGRILQVEYAERTVRNCPACVGMICSDGVVIIADKRLKDQLVLQQTASKIYKIDEHIILTFSGILSDARILAERAQLVAQQHRVTFDTPADVETIIRDISNIKQQSSQYAGIRPFGVRIMMAGIDTEKRLFVSDVTGSYFGYKATAIGENDEKIKEILRREFKDNMTIAQGIKLALRIFKKIDEKKFDPLKFEIAYISSKDKKIMRVKGEEILKFIKK